MSEWNKVYEKSSKEPTENDNFGGFDILSIYSMINEETESLIIKALALNFFPYFKERVISDYLPNLTYANFFEEADEYIASNKDIQIPQGQEKQARIQYAQAIFKELKEQVELMEFDDETNSIMLPSGIADCELGTTSKPTLSIVSRLWTEFIGELQKSIDSGEFKPAPGSQEEAETETSENSE